jgi:hypothetical protein
LNEFEKLSRLPVLLNTSFNVKGQPIVRTPKEALDTFLFASLDALVLGDYVVEARSARPLERATLSEPGNPSDLIALQRGFENH